MIISIFGLGYVGSVSAACLADMGHTIWGVDINQAKVDLVNAGRSPIVEPGLNEKLDRVVKSRTLRATNKAEEALANSDVAFVVVATPSNEKGEIDPSHLYSACEQIAHSLQAQGRSQIVVIRSSALPQTLGECKKIFDRLAPNLVELCSNPEFLREGVAIKDFERPSFTLLGTQSPDVESALRDIYADIDAPVYVMGMMEAVMVKYASNVFHGLKVAFANEIGQLCKAQGIDSHIVMSIFSKDKQLNISECYLRPGFAFGGSCLPKDIRAVCHIAADLDVPVPMIAGIMPSNHSLIERTYDEIVAKGLRRVGFIGLSFKGNTDDLRESPFVELAKRLLSTGSAEVKVYDPNVDRSMKMAVGNMMNERIFPGVGKILVDDLERLVSNSDLLIIAHGYPEVDNLSPDLFGSKTIFDLAYVDSLKSAASDYNGATW